jgi:hypothetical protein
MQQSIQGFTQIRNSRKELLREKRIVLIMLFKIKDRTLKEKSSVIMQKNAAMDTVIMQKNAVMDTVIMRMPQNKLEQITGWFLYFVAQEGIVKFQTITDDGT